MEKNFLKLACETCEVIDEAMKHHNAWQESMRKVRAKGLLLQQMCEKEDRGNRKIQQEVDEHLKQFTPKKAI